MNGPIRLLRSERIRDYANLGNVYEWSKESAYLIIDRVAFRGTAGAVLCYYNPPVHQVGNPGLDAYLEGLNAFMGKRDEFAFLLLYGSNDPVHAGGDLKESLQKLERTLEAKRDKEAQGATADDIDALYAWADDRIKKGVSLHGKVRSIAQDVRVVAVCGGGTRYGGSAEIPLMAGFLVGDSRGAMCFSEATIGLIPGWSGVARALVKAGLTNAEYMAKTSVEVKADELKKIGIYNAVVPISFPFPKRQKTENPEADRARYLEALQKHDDDTGLLLLPTAFHICTCASEEIPIPADQDRAILATKEEMDFKVERRMNPQNYARLWSKPLREVQKDISELGRPLAPQSIEALNVLLEGYDPATFDEAFFVKKEMEADARLYRDKRFREGLLATLEQRVADFRG